MTDSGGGAVAAGSWNPGESVVFQGASIAINGQPANGDVFTVGTSVNRSVFDTVGRLITGLEGDTLTSTGRASFQNTLNNALMGLDQVERHLSDIRSTIGARLAAVEDQKSNNEELALQLQSTLSTVRDVDYPKAISDLETELTGLEAAQKVFAQTRTLSLFDLL